MLNFLLIGLYALGGLVFLFLPFVLCVYVVLAHSDLFFSPKGRIKRLTYWEGLVAWGFLNTLILMIIISGMMYSTNFLTKTLGDTDYSIYANLFFALFFFQWVFAMWTLVAICAKRWHDLNSPGWLSSLNVVPVVVIGWGLLEFLSGLARTLYYRLTADPNALGPGFDFFSLYSQAATNYYDTFIGPNLLYTCYAAAVVVGVFLYPGLFKGSNGGNAFGKTVA